MVRKPTKYNYRQYYKEYYGIDFPAEYSIHHIDENRENNKIDNLLLLPKDVHEKLHYYLDCEYYKYNGTPLMQATTFPIFEDKLSEYCDLIFTVSKWRHFKNYLDNQILLKNVVPSFMINVILPQNISKREWR